MKEQVLEELFLNERRKRWVYYILACAIPAILWSIVFSKPYIAQDRFTLLTSDLNGQYINYLMYFRNAILNGDGLFFSFSGLLGIDTAALIGYYFLSPLNLLILIFPADRIARAVYWIVFLKVILAGFTASMFFGKKRGYDLRCLVFSTTYALSGYIFAYFMHIMWLDSIYMLPLVALGLEKLVKEGKKSLYIISLAYTFVTCYYTGYMVAGFSLLFLFYLLFIEKRKVKTSFVQCFSFFASSLIASLISAFALVPTLLSQYGSRVKDLSEEPITHTVVQMISRLFTGVYSMKEFSVGAPNVYVGMLVLFFVVLYFMPQKEKRNKRALIVTAIFLLAFILSFSIDRLDIIWHIFARPHSFTHRYAFAFVFVMLIIAERSFFEERKKVSLASIVFADLIIVGMYIAVLLMKTEAVNPVLLHLDLISVMILSLLLYFSEVKEKKNFKKASVIAIVAIQLIMLVVNGYAYVSVYHFDDHSSEAYYSVAKAMIDRVNRYDNGLYRTEKSFLNSHNDAMMLSYNGFSHFSSADRYFIRNFMGDLGYNEDDNWVYYDQGATIAGDSLLGMKYFLSREPCDYFSIVDTVNDAVISENPYALPVGLSGDSEILKIKLDDGAPFDNQQRIYNALLGKEENFFNIYDDYSMDVTENMLWEQKDDGKNIFGKESEDQEGIVTIRFTARDSYPTYLYLSAEHEPEVLVRVNGEDLGSYISIYHQGVLPIGSFEAGSEVEIEVSILTLYAGFYDPQIASVDMEKFAAVSQKLRQRGWTVLEHNSMYINAEITSEEDQVVFTSIPYFSGWKVYVDGIETETLKVCDTLLAFPVQEGNHWIEMKYEVEGGTLGAVLSGTGVVLLAIAIYWEKRKKMVKSGDQGRNESER